MKKQYSQNDEERVILEYFGKRKGVFLSIGENDGVTFSNVRALAERGWSGICIEPSPVTFKKLEALYKDNPFVGCYEVAIGETNGKIVLADSGSLINKGDTSLVSTIVPEEKKRFETAVVYNNVLVECKTFNVFTHDNGLNYLRPDFISIDAEGMDASILDQIQTHGMLNYAHMVCIEWNGDKGLALEYDSILMLDQGMHLIYTSAENLIYAR